MRIYFENDGDIDERLRERINLEMEEIVKVARMKLAGLQNVIRQYADHAIIFMADVAHPGIKIKNIPNEALHKEILQALSMIDYESIIGKLQ